VLVLVLVLLVLVLELELEQEEYSLPVPAASLSLLQGLRENLGLEGVAHQHNCWTRWHWGLLGGRSCG